MNMMRNIIEQTASLREAISQLNRLSGSEMTLFVVDGMETLKIVGTLTDGDVRRALLNGIGLEQAVSGAMFTEFKRLKAAQPDQVDTIREIRGRGITMVPVVDPDGRLVEIADLSRRVTQLPLSAILMAGGKGERLRPMTLETPKPLLKIDGKAIVDYNIEALARVGIKDITVCTRYLAEQIHQHFSEPVAGINVKCVTETMPMGTIGAAALVARSEHGDTLVMNSDLLTTISFEDMYLKHRDTQALVTVGVIPYQVSVPFAILTTEGNNVTGIEEKPSYSHYANAGIYIFNNKVLDRLNVGSPADAPDLIRDVIDEGGKVTYHVINGTWIDIGTPTDFAQAQELMRHHRNLSAK